MQKKQSAKKVCRVVRY